MTRPQTVWGDDLDLFADPALAGQPLMLRRAAAVRKVLLEMPIAIEDDDLIVGNTLQDGQVVRTKLPRYGTPDEYAQAASQGSALSAQLSHKTPFYYDILDSGLAGIIADVDAKLADIATRPPSPENGRKAGSLHSHEDRGQRRDRTGPSLCRSGRKHKRMRPPARRAVMSC